MRDQKFEDDQSTCNRLPDTSKCLQKVHAGSCPAVNGVCVSRHTIEGKSVPTVQTSTTSDVALSMT